MAGDEKPVILLSGPASRGGGQYFGIWAVAIVRQIHKRVKVILPYEGRESDRLRRFVRQIGMADMLIAPGHDLTWAQLVSCANLFLAPATDEICIEPIAWAMAAGLPVVGTAVRTICELLADKHNGLLCRPGQPKALAGRILMALEETSLARRTADVGRAQAYEVFGIRAFADHYLRAYENARDGVNLDAGIVDTAMVA